MSPRVRTIAHGIESLIDTVSDAIQAPLYVRCTLYLVLQSHDLKGKHSSHSTM